MSSSPRAILSSASIPRALLHLCLPMIAGFSVGAVYNVINGGFVGSLHSTPMLAALTFSMPIFALIMAIGGVFGVGAGTSISRLMGEQEDAATDRPAAALRIRQTGSFALYGALAVGVVVGVIGLLLATPLAHVLGATTDAVAPTAQYVGMMFAFAPVLVASFALEQLVRAEGAAVVSMIGLIASTVANLIFDMLFILVLPWGVLGAGLALGLSNVVMAGYYIWWLSARSQNISVAPRHFSADGAMLRTVFGVGASELLQSAFLIVTSLVSNWVAMRFGAALLASVGVAQRIAQLPEMICMGVYFGALPLFGFAFGARNRERLRRAVSGAAWSIAGITLVFSGLVFLFRHQVLAIFSQDPSVLADGTLVLMAMLVSTFFNGFTGLNIALFQATGQMRNATIMSVAQGVLYIPVVLGMTQLWGLVGFVWAITVTELLTLGLALVLSLVSRRALAAGPSTEQVQEAEAMLEAA